MKIFIKKNYYEKNEYESFTHKKCQKCNTIKEIKEFGKTKTNGVLGWGWRSNCRECDRRLCKEYAAGNKLKRNERLKKYRKNNPKIMKVIDRKRKLKYKYGITLEDYNRMFNEQEGKCFICHLNKKLVIDHCHKTGKVRKLLCHGCNIILGKIEKGEFDIFNDYINHCHADVLIKYANK